MQDIFGFLRKKVLEIGRKDQGGPIDREIAGDRQMNWIFHFSFFIRLNLRPLLTNPAWYAILQVYYPQ